MTQFCSAIYGLALAAMPAAAAHADVWDEAYDVSTRSRFIPMELILGAAWNGHRSINYPSGTFRQTAGGSTWKGPESWTHPVTGRRLTVYYRSRGGLNAADQVFAVRDDQAAIGRAGDSRFGIDACDQEGEYPLGIWKQGEMRTFHYTCWYDKKPDAKSRPSASRISISIAANGNTASASNGSCATTAPAGNWIVGPMFSRPGKASSWSREAFCEALDTVSVL